MLTFMHQLCIHMQMCITLLLGTIVNDDVVLNNSASDNWVLSSDGFVLHDFIDNCVHLA